MENTNYSTGLSCFRLLFHFFLSSSSAKEEPCAQRPTRQASCSWFSISHHWSAFWNNRDGYSHYDKQVEVDTLMIALLHYHKTKKVDTTLMIALFRYYRTKKVDTTLIASLFRYYRTKKVDTTLIASLFHFYLFQGICLDDFTTAGFLRLAASFNLVWFQMIQMQVFIRDGRTLFCPTWGRAEEILCSCSCPCSCSPAWMKNKCHVVVVHLQKSRRSRLVPSCVAIMVYGSPSHIVCRWCTS